MVNFQPYGVGESSISLSGAHLSVSGGNASATPIVFSVTARTWRAYDKMKQNNSVFFLSQIETQNYKMRKNQMFYAGLILPNMCKATTGTDFES